MEELIEKAKKGNKDAFTELIISMQDELYKIARMRLSNEEDIDDVIQETMLSTLYGIKHLNYPQYFKTWIIKILINKCNVKQNNKKKSHSYINKTLIKGRRKVKKWI